MVYDDDRDNPLSDRPRLTDRLWSNPPARSRGNSRKSSVGKEPSTTVYRCSGRTEDGKRCKRKKRGEPDFVCFDHAGKKKARRWARR